MTLGRYTHANLYDLDAAIQNMPRLPVGPNNVGREQQRLRATGTDDAHVSSPAMQHSEKNATTGEGAQGVVALMVAGPAGILCDAVTTLASTGTDEDNHEPHSAHVTKRREKQGFENDCESLRDNESGEGGIRTREEPLSPCRFSRPVHLRRNPIPRLRL